MAGRRKCKARTDACACQHVILCRIDTVLIITPNFICLLQHWLAKADAEALLRSGALGPLSPRVAVFAREFCHFPVPG